MYCHQKVSQPALLLTSDRISRDDLHNLVRFEVIRRHFNSSPEKLLSDSISSFNESVNEIPLEIDLK